MKASVYLPDESQLKRQEHKPVQPNNQTTMLVTTMVILPVYKVSKYRAITPQSATLVVNEIINTTLHSLGALYETKHLIADHRLVWGAHFALVGGVAK